jgi:hypothetical protein
MKNETNEINGTKVCKYCKTDIPEGAKVCPNCRKKQGMGCLPKILIVVLIVIILAVIASAGSDGSSSGIDNSGAKDTSSKQTEAAETTEEESDEDSNVVKVGGSYEGDGLKFTVEDADLDYSVEDDEYGFYDLDEGLKYVSVDFTFENTGSVDEYVSIYDFDCYADDQNCEQQYLDSDFVNVNLSAGRSVSFTTYYAVPEDASSIELEYTANIWTDEKIVVKLQ